MRFTPQGRLSRSRRSAAQVVSIFDLMGFIGIASVPSNSGTDFLSTASPEDTCVTPGIVSPAGAGEAEERAGWITNDRSASQ